MQPGTIPATGNRWTHFLARTSRPVCPVRRVSAHRKARVEWVKGGVRADAVCRANPYPPEHARIIHFGRVGPFFGSDHPPILLGSPKYEMGGDRSGRRFRVQHQVLLPNQRDLVCFHPRSRNTFGDGNERLRLRLQWLMSSGALCSRARSTCRSTRAFVTDPWLWDPGPPLSARWSTECSFAASDGPAVATGPDRYHFTGVTGDPGTHLSAIRPLWSDAVQGRRRRRAKRACPGQRRSRVAASLTAYHLGRGRPSSVPKEASFHACALGARAIERDAQNRLKITGWVPGYR